MKMLNKTLMLWLALCVVALAGCSSAPKTKYAWGKYEDALYQYYKSPTTPEAYLDALQKVVDDAIEKERKVPPGVYAELGYFMMLANQPDKAIQFFEMERASWPEAVPFMNKMISLAKGDATEELKPMETTPVTTTPLDVPAAPVGTVPAPEAPAATAVEAPAVEVPAMPTDTKQ
jgi:hypothetical protein